MSKLNAAAIISKATVQQVIFAMHKCLHNIYEQLACKSASNEGTLHLFSGSKLGTNPKGVWAALRRHIGRWLHSLFLVAIGAIMSAISSPSSLIDNRVLAIPSRPSVLSLLKN